MKTRQLAMLCVGAAPLILTDPSPAEFVGIQSYFASDGQQIGFLAQRIYAVFDNPGQDEMLAVYGTVDDPLTLSGCYFQHTLESINDAPPSGVLVEFFPELAFDSFVTIGVRALGGPSGQPVNNTELLTGWPGLDNCPISTTMSGWAVPSGSPQADPFNRANSWPGTGRILIGQFTGDFNRSGTMFIQYRSNGVIEERLIKFTSEFARCVEVSDCIDHPCFGTWSCAAPNGLCFAESFPSPDCNNNRVLDSCDLDFGTSPDINVNGVPDECECLGDCGNGDGMVDIDDFLALLGVWGQIGVTCDIDSGGVGITDFLMLLAAWGPCP